MKLNDKVYFVNCQCDGSVTSFVADEEQLTIRLSQDLDWEELYLWTQLENSKKYVRDTYGHLTTMVYFIRLEQGSIEVYEIKEKQV